VRLEPVPGVSILAPPIGTSGATLETASSESYCKPAHPYGVWPSTALAYGCIWSRASLRRYLALTWYVDAFEPQASPNENLERLRRELVAGFIPAEDLKPLAGPWRGWEWRTRAQGDMIRDRWIVIGTGFVLLQAVSPEDDPFPEGELFFESLAISTAALQNR
jgi:hypothetical protein